MKNTCFETCPIDSINYNNSNEFYCKLKCPFERPFELIEKQICVSSCTVMERYLKLCLTNYNGDRVNEIQDMVMLDIKNDIIETFEYNFIINNSSVIYEEKNIKYEITYISNDTKNEKINLGECENKLKEFYNIGLEESLYILKIDVFLEGKLGPKIFYELYYPFDGIHLYQLDLSICEGIEISIGFQYNITENNLDIFDKNSPYYNDICYQSTNEEGVDITLDDRQKEFSNNNRSLCDENCNFAGYNKETGKVECSCEIKASLPFVSQIKIDKDKLYHFINIKNIVNFKVMLCYNLFFSMEIIKMNIGFYCLIPTIIVYFICIVIFYKKDYFLLKTQIKEIVLAKLNSNKLMSFSENTIKYKKRRNKKIDNNDKKSKLNNIQNNDDNEFSSNNKIKQIIENKVKQKKNKTFIKFQIQNIKNILKYNYDELNNLDYNKAFMYDKRNFFQLYLSLLKTKHLLFKIFDKRDYNSISVKILLMFFNFTSCYAINALFFSDETMHQIYEDDGKFNFIYQLPQIIYSTVISYILDSFIDFLALSQDNIINIKQSKNLKLIKKKAKTTRAVLRIKFILFFIVNFILIFLFGYYLGCFCAVYKNTQYHLIKDTLISFGISNITPFGINLFPCLFRIYSLSSKSKGKKIMYKLSQFLLKF